MAHAEKCPICGGEGKLPNNFSSTSVEASRPICYGCNGKGWVEVSDEQQSYCPPRPTLEEMLGFKTRIS